VHYQIFYISLHDSYQHSHTRKLSYSKDDRAMCPIYGCPENFRRVPEYAHSYLYRNF